MREQMFVAILILSCVGVGVVLTDITDNCRKVQEGVANETFLFPFKWSATELKSVTCDKYGTSIGHCRGVDTFQCSTEASFSGLYNMNSNADLTQVTLTITIFNENRSGHYCCSKENKNESTCECVQKAEPLTPKPIPPTEVPSEPEVTTRKATSNGIQMGLNNWVMVLTACVALLLSPFVDEHWGMEI